MRGDLVKLAALLHVEVTDKMKVDDIKALCRPIIKDLKMETPTKVDGGSSSSAQPVTPPQATMTSSPPRATSVASSSAPTPGIGLEELKGLFAQQDQKYQTMLSQLMQHVMAMQSSQVPHYDMTRQAMEVELTEEQIQQINADYHRERWAERYEAQHGEFSSVNQWDLLKPDGDM